MHGSASCVRSCTRASALTTKWLHLWRRDGTVTCNWMGPASEQVTASRRRTSFKVPSRHQCDTRKSGGPYRLEVLRRSGRMANIARMLTKHYARGKTAYNLVQLGFRRSQLVANVVNLECCIVLHDFYGAQLIFDQGRRWRQCVADGRQCHDVPIRRQGAIKDIPHVFALYMKNASRQ